MRNNPFAYRSVIALALCLAMGIAWPVMAGQGQGLETASQCISVYPDGTINWTTGRVSAVGRAAPESSPEGKLTAVPGSARADASRKIIRLLKQVRISPDLSVGEYAAGNDIILAGIEKTAQDAVATRQVYTSAMDVSVWMETRIFGGFLQLVLPDHIRQIPKISAQKPKGAVSSGTAAYPAPYTGLVIDGRGLGIQPVLYPVIVSEQGREVFSSVFISREFAVQYGVATFFCDMSCALSHERIGANPLTVKALRKSGDKESAIVISMADAKLIEKILERHTFLKECRVAIVADPIVADQ